MDGEYISHSGAETKMDPNTRVLVFAPSFKNLSADTLDKMCLLNMC